MNGSSRTNYLPEIIGVSVVVLIGAAMWPSMKGPDGVEVLEAEVAPAPYHTKPISPPGNWQPANVTQRKQAAKSILAQLEAFKRDDYKTAVTYQSSALRRNFPSVTKFRQMMLVTYPQFASYKKVRFGLAVVSPDGNRVQMAVRLQGRDGNNTGAVYSMVREKGVFRVDGVMGGMAEPGSVQVA